MQYDKKKGNGTMKKWLFGHLVLLLAMAAFALYGVVVLYLLPTMPYHCFMHDVLHLYCPLCGGTRAFMAVFHFDLVTVITYNPAVFLATLVFLCFDLRALFLAWRGSERPLFPRFLLPLAVVWFIGYTVLRNILLFFGVDAIGDLVPYISQHLTGKEPFFAAAFLLMLGIFLARALLSPRAACWWLLTALSLALFLAVWVHPLCLLALLPLFGIVLYLYVLKRGCVIYAVPAQKSRR